MITLPLGRAKRAGNIYSLIYIPVLSFLSIILKYEIREMLHFEINLLLYFKVIYL